jgi:hypothetical protein
MKLVLYLILFGLGWYSTSTSAQDLIERTQLGVTMDVSRQSSSVAYSESQSLKHVGPYQVVNPFELAPDSRRSTVDQYIDGQVMLDLPGGTLPRLMKTMKDGVSLRIPVAPDREVELDLVEVFPLNSAFEGTISDGRKFTILDYPARFYRGAIKGIPNSFAAITIADGMFRGLIGDDYGNYVLSELNNSDREFILYNDKKLKMERTFACGVEDAPYDDEMQQILHLTEPIVNNNRIGDCIDVMVEMEEDFYDDWNNVTSANNFIYALFNEAAMLYNNENISITLKDIIMWTTTDPYTSTDMCNSTTNDLLDEYADERQNGFNGRLAHLITSRNAGGGCAFIDVLCSNWTSPSSSSNHAVSSGMSTSVIAFPTYSWNVMVFAHEMGHNVGSRHTHACVWNGNNTAIDGCATTEGSCSQPPIPAGGGTIMSYCHQQSVGINFNLGFGTQPGNVLRAETYGASCNLDCGNISQCPREIYLDGNVQSDTYYADRKVEMGGTVLSGRSVNLRCDIGSIIWNPGFRVNNGGSLSADQAACTAALDGNESNKPQQATMNTEISSEAQSFNK